MNSKMVYKKTTFWRNWIYPISPHHNSKIVSSKIWKRKFLVRKRIKNLMCFLHRRNAICLFPKISNHTTNKMRTIKKNLVLLIKKVWTNWSNLTNLFEKSMYLEWRRWTLNWTFSTMAVIQTMMILYRANYSIILLKKKFMRRNNWSFLILKTMVT